MSLHNHEQKRKPYPTDLTDDQWKKIKPLLPAAKSDQKTGGRPRTAPLREIMNACIYIARAGCAWRLLPHDLPDWRLVRHYFEAWQKDGTWERLHDALRAEVRVKAGKRPFPSAGILDSQSVPTTKKGAFVALMRVKR
jgi:putative transposase